ncbi:uncharacterized protein ATC70_008925 [Mucor velutinosus]|uniref:PH domain-containing protein n=1 Tax=Mucor velutinosus TaxID=708070 RepID=A0AAN7DKE1_9FUNG|nr:hypothetical protein ATC70_008925 [Mucor velutinosus]
MDSEAPINAGHRFVVEAENYEDNENWLKAAEAHTKAAEQFEIAIHDSVEDEAIKTLRLLSSNHQKKANELNRKAQRLIKAAAKSRMHQMVGSRGGLRNALSSSQQHQHQHYYHSSQEYGNASTSNSSSIISRLAGIHASTVDSGDIGESYTLLPSIERQELDFLKFFESVNQLVENVCNPAVAFTSAPLNENDIPIPDEVDVDQSSTILQQSHNTNATMMDSYFIVTDPKEESMVSTIQKKMGSLSINDATAPNIIDSCKLENEKLRVQLAHLKKRLKSLQMSAEENNMLKSSVLQFRDDVHKQAKRIMQSHHESSMRASASLIAGGVGAAGPNIMHGSRHSPLAIGNGNGSHDLASRLRDLEEENKQLRLQNEKQKVLVNRYKERWEILKANAKKRRAPSSLSTVVSNVITEELEEEIL